MSATSRVWLSLGLSLIFHTAVAAPAATPDARFDTLAKSYLDELVKARPHVATELGIHTEDARLDDLSTAGRARDLLRIGRWQKRLVAVDAKALSPSRQRDLTMLRAAVDAQRFELDKVQSWRHWPGHYTQLASASIYTLIKRTFALPEQRLQAVIARERQIPGMLRAGATQLGEVPRVALDITLDQMPGMIDFFRSDVPRAFVDVKDAKLVGQLQLVTKEVVAALVDYERFLRSEIAPRADAPFALGEARYKEKLRLEEMVDEPLDSLLARGEAELHRLQAELLTTAAKVDAKRDPRQVLLESQAQHATAANLLTHVSSRLAGLRAFLVDHDLVTVPSPVMPRVEETPAFMRATTLASMETPGPFEATATEAYFNVTLPDPKWSAAEAESYLRGAFSNGVVDVTAVHEAFPGHYIQFLWLPKSSSLVRKVEGAGSNIEGWAHYCEQMMLDEGYGDGAPSLRLAQLQDALLRAARYVVGIRMHTRGMTLPEAIEFFQKEGYQDKSVATMEARRGAGDPTYLVYTLGKLEILRLREDYKKKLGANYTIKKFHDAFLAEGTLPLPLVRDALLH